MSQTGAASNKGEVWAFFGGVIASTPDLIVTGETNVSNLGSSLAMLGDLNNDNYDDFIAGAPYSDIGGTNNGAAFIYNGNDPMSAEAAVTLTGEADSDFYGDDVNSAGNVNGDSYADVVVGANGAGKAYVYFGGASVSTEASVVLTGSAAESFGNAVGAGDFNGDGYSDIAVGAPQADIGATNNGAVYVFFGGPGMVDTSSPDVTITGEAGSNWIGYYALSAGDVNRDGYDDLLAGSHYAGAEGEVYIFFGGDPMDNTADVTITGEVGSSYFGERVSPAGDLNDDGFPDILISDTSAGTDGKVFIYYGGKNMDNVVDMILTGEASSDDFGSSMSSLGDVNNDTYDDIVVGAQGADFGGANRGRVYVFYGGPSMDTTADKTMTGDLDNGYLGKWVGGARP